MDGDTREGHIFLEPQAYGHGGLVNEFLRGNHGGVGVDANRLDSTARPFVGETPETSAAIVPAELPGAIHHLDAALRNLRSQLEAIKGTVIYNNPESHLVMQEPEGRQDKVISLGMNHDRILLVKQSAEHFQPGILDRLFFRFVGFPRIPCLGIELALLQGVADQPVHADPGIAEIASTPLGVASLGDLQGAGETYQHLTEILARGLDQGTEAAHIRTTAGDEERRGHPAGLGSLEQGVAGHDIVERPESRVHRVDHIVEVAAGDMRVELHKTGDDPAPAGIDKLVALRGLPVRCGRRDNLLDAAV